MQAFHIIVPEVVKVVNILRQREVLNIQAQLVSNLALADAHLPVGVRVVLVHPLQPDVAVAVALYDLSLQRMMVSPYFAPSQRDDVVAKVLNMVGKPSFQAVRRAYLVPNDVVRLSRQRVF